MEELDLQAVKDFLETTDDDSFEPGRFTVDDDGKANWVLREIAKIDVEKKRIERNYQEDLARLNDWRNRELERLTSPRNFFESLIAKYVGRIREAAEAAGKKAKSFRYTLPAGIVRIKDREPEFKRDEKALAGFLEQNDYAEFVSTVEVKKPDWAAFKKRLSTDLLEIKNGKLVDKVTGQVVEGVEVIERGAKCEIELESLNSAGPIQRAIEERQREKAVATNGN